MPPDTHPPRTRQRRFHVHPAALGDWYGSYHGAGSIAPADCSQQPPTKGWPLTLKEAAWLLVVLSFGAFLILLAIWLFALIIMGGEQL